MDNPTPNNGTIDPNTTEYGIPNRINTSNLSGYKYYAAMVANLATTSETIIDSISQAIRPFK